MGKATLAKQRACGLIGQGRVAKLYDEGNLIVLFQDDYDRLTARLAELERENRLLSDLTTGAAERNEVAAHILREAMTSKDK